HIRRRVCRRCQKSSVGLLGKASCAGVRSQEHCYLIDDEGIAKKIGAFLVPTMQMKGEDKAMLKARKLPMQRPGSFGDHRQKQGGCHERCKAKALRLGPQKR